MEIYDLENCKTNDRNGTYGGHSGYKEGIIWNDKNWIVKYSKKTREIEEDLLSCMTSPLSEFIGSHIYEILGYDVHSTRLGIRDRRIVVVCKDFCENKGDLMEIRTLKNIHNRDLAEALKKSFSSSDVHMVDLESLLIQFKYNPVLSVIPGLQERFWNCVVIDILIDNNNRSDSDWGVLSDNAGYRLAPIFDNGDSFSCKISESKIISLLNDSEKLKISSADTITVYSLNGKVLSSKEMLSVNNAQLRQALQKNVPLIQSKMPDIRKFIQDIPEEYNGLPVCSAIRKEFYMKGMEIRFDELLQPALYHF